LLARTPGLTVLSPPDRQRWNHWFYSLYIEDDSGEDSADQLRSVQDNKNKKTRHDMAEGTQRDMAEKTRCNTAEGTQRDRIAGARRDRVMKALIKDSIQCRPVWKLVHTQKPYKEFRALDIEKAYDYEKHILNLPCSTNLSEDDVRYVCSKILEHVR
jgi:dTDP-4-amino-4,6-dideoxygalactose transaminase